MAIEITKHSIKSNSATQQVGPGGFLQFLNKDIALFGKKFGDKQKEKFYTEMNTLLNAGVDIKTALELLEGEHFKKEEKKIVSTIKETIIKGKTLSQALESSGHFTSYEVHSIRIGEESGKLNTIVNELGIYFKKRIQLKRQMTGIFTYPVFLLLVSTGILYFMLNNVVPMFADVFKKFGKELPSFTQKIIALSNWTQAYFIYILLVVIGTIAFLYANKSKTWFRKYWSLALIRMPLFGKLIQKVYLARFCQSMHLLISAKTPLTDALTLVEKMIDFYPIDSALKSIREDITRGTSLHEALRPYTFFELRLVSLIKVAEEVNQLDQMFGKLATQYNEEVEHQTAITGKLVEPLLILIIGAMVGTILIAMYQPMFEMNNLME